MKYTPKYTLNYKIAPVAVITLISLMTTSSYAQSVYTFTGASCPSQGAWTHAALMQADQVTGAIRQLKDNPACNGLIKAVTALQVATDDAFGSSAAAGDRSGQDHMESLAPAMQALGDGLMEGGNLNAQTAATLMNTEIQAAGKTTDIGLRNAIDTQNPTSVPRPTAVLSSMYEKYKRPLAKGLQLATNVFTMIPQYDECLIGQPDAAMTMISGAIKMAAAFSASGEGVGDRLGNAVAGLAKMLKDRKFTKAIRKQHEIELWNSISCLLESATKNYCDVANAQEILMYTQKQYKATHGSGNKVKDTQKAFLATVNQYHKDASNPGYDNPLEGYYLLVRELPVISNWLQSVIFGAVPRLTTDANFKNAVLTDVTTLMQANFTITGTLSERLLYYKEQKTPETKRSVLFNIINDMYGLMDPSTPAGKFYSATKTTNMLPFFLVGLDTIPQECTGPASQAMSWTDWMTKNPKTGGFAEIFQNPDALVEKVQSRVREMTAGASEKASIYYRKRLIVDMPNLVNQTMSSQYLTVYEAYKHVFLYLERFKGRLKRNSLDQAMLVSVQQTQDQMNRFFDSYNDLMKLGKKVIQANGSYKSIPSKEINEAAEKVIGTAFDEFNMLYQRDAFLTNRLTTFIEKDFALRIREGLNMNEHTKDLMIINQNHLLEKLVEVHGVNPTDSAGDLSTAVQANQRSIEAIEDVFGDTMYNMILSVRTIAEGKGEQWMKAQLDKRAYHDSHFAAYDPLSQWFATQWTKFSKPDLYSTKGANSESRIKRDDKFGSYQRIVGKICSQTLAFETREKFNSICEGTSMRSWYNEKQLDFVYDQNVPHNKQQAVAMKNDPDFYGKNVCAYNRFQIRNIVKYLNDQSLQTFGTTEGY